MDNEALSDCSQCFIAQLYTAELHEAVTVLVLTAAVLAQKHSVNIEDVFVMFAAGIQSSSEFLNREVH